MNPNSWLMLCRSVRFEPVRWRPAFQQLLRWCHEAYEESLERFGLNAAEIFRPWLYARVRLPIVHCSADFRRLDLRLTDDPAQTNPARSQLF